MDYKVVEIPKTHTLDWLKNKHYARTVPSIVYAFGLFATNKMIGICCYGTSANSHYNSWGEFRCLELVRLCVNDGLPKNVASFFLGRTFKILPKPLAVVSFADSGQNHHGYIYQATNWLYTGKSSGGRIYQDKNGHMIHERSMSEYRLKIPSKSRVEIAEHFGWKVLEVTKKHRYFMFLGSKSEIRKMKKILFVDHKHVLQPYPKGKNSNYDASYQASVNLTLF